MGEWHVIKIERVCRSEPRDNAELFDSEQHQNRPRDIDELDREKQNPQRYRRLRDFAREARSVMTDEHWVLRSAVRINLNHAQIKLLRLRTRLGYPALNTQSSIK